MDTKSVQSSSAMQLTEQQGAVIVCEEGQLWLTDNGDDIILKNGECHRIQSMQAVVIEPLRKNSRFHLEEARKLHASWQSRLQRLLNRWLQNDQAPHAPA